MNSFVHLHTHSHFSLLDGANKLDALIQKAAELKMPALALTDHGNLFGAVQFHDLALKHGVKPIIGCEVYVARESRHQKNGRSDQSNHLVLLARNETGYHNLMRLVSFGYLEGFYYRPRVDLELLQDHSQGLIALSACLKGIVAWNLAQDREAEAAEQAGRLAEIFGRGNFFLELQDHGIEEQAKVNQSLVEMARRLDLPLVATNDCHYLERNDAFAHDVLLCVQTGKTVEDTNRLSYRSEEFFFKTGAEMSALFGHLPGVLENTLEIADRCQFQLAETQNIFPDFEVPPGFTIDGYFEKVVRDGFDERLAQLERLEKLGRLRHPLETYRNRLNREIEIIRQMQFPSYFLIVWDFIRYAREEGIPVGPGRGSAAGSLVSYAMRITDIDPLQYDLLFERFLNPERVTPPDIDIDFCMLRRNQVIDYVTRKYGRENVSQIITFGTMAARGAIRDVGRGLNIPYAEVDRIAKLVPQGVDSTLEKALQSVMELKEVAAAEERFEKLISVARQLEGLARHASTHAAGVVIAPRPLIDLIPLYKTNKDEITTQFPMTDLERLGLLKMDFLALTTLTVIQQALEQIRRQRGVEVLMDELGLDDADTFRVFCEGRTTGIFQFESSGMRDILRRLQPSRFEDLIALNALYRPGPIQGGMVDDFIKRRHGQVKIEYEVPELEEILKETYGVIVYQEQVMQIASKLGGFSLGEADVLRRAMGKKKKQTMQAQRKRFLDGCKSRRIDAAKARKIFELMEQFAGYGFNKSHSTAYALLAYQTAYLKAHFPVEFMAALLNSEMSNTDKVVKFLSECRDMGIRVLPPDINLSDLHFQAAGPDIRFGLAAIRNVGESAIRAVIKCRQEDGTFAGFFDFCERVDLRAVNKRVLESLIKAGAFDSFNCRRRALVQILDRAIDRGQKAQRDRIVGQRGLFMGSTLSGFSGDRFEPIPTCEEWSEPERWAYEKEALGFFISGHPLQHFEAELKRFSNTDAGRLAEETSSKDVAIGGMITGLRKLRTRKGDPMASFKLEDLSGTVEVLVWPNVYERVRRLLDSDAPVLVKGRCEVDAGGDRRLLCSEMMPLTACWKESVQKTCIRIPLPILEPAKFDELDRLLRRYPGRCPLEFELRKQQGYRIRVIPSELLSVNPVPDFVRDVEDLFGENSVTLYT